MSELDAGPDCEAFDDAVAELALGLLDPATTDSLLAHAEGCEHCRAELDSLAAAADRLVLLAPEAEPPAGFERRALAAMGVPPARSRRRPVLVAAAAALVVVGLLVGRQIGVSTAPSTSVASGVLTDQQGQSRGVVTVLRSDDPVLTMTLAGLDPGETYHCEVRTPDGRMTEVAAWTVPDSGGGAWKVPLASRLASATSAVVTEDGGATVATAALH